MSAPVELRVINRSIINKCAKGSESFLYRGNRGVKVLLKKTINLETDKYSLPYEVVFLEHK